MFIFLSKFLPQFIYPLGLSSILIVLALFLRKRPRWLTICLVAALGLIWISGNRWVAISLARSLEWQYLPNPNLPTAEVIVVLGGGTETNLPPRPATELNNAGDRVLYAYRLYEARKAQNLLLSGGSIASFDQRASSPAEEMAELLRLMKVPESALWLETASRNTYENAYNSYQILHQKNINRILLVTSAMHMPRSVALFKKQGFEVIPAPTDYTVTQAEWDALFTGNLGSILLNLVPSPGNISLSTAALKEYIGMAVYRMRGWMD
ncbi:MAG TPA: YdcF family protein [Anaerolineaceae bacterium]